MTELQPDPNTEDRDAAIRQLERDAKLSHRPAVAGQGNRTVAVAVSGLALLAIVAMFAIQHYLGRTHKQAATGITLAERRNVATLDDALEAGPAPASASSAPKANGNVVPALLPDAGTSDVQQQEKVLREEQATQARMQAEKLRQARVKSAIIAINNDNAATTGPEATGNESASTLAGSNRGGTSHTADKNLQFAADAGGKSVKISRAESIDHPECWILRSKLIDATVAERIDSDLPGTISALVAHDVYGEIGDIPLLPAGTRLTGTYNASISKGQTRIFTVWTRAVTPAPRMVKVSLDSYGADQLGTAGMPGQVDNHFLEIYGNSALISLLGAGASTTGVSGVDQGNSVSAYRQSIQQAMAQASQQLLQPYAQIPPTILAKPGQRIQILVNQDLDFRSVCRPQISAGRESGVTYLD